CQTTAYAAGSHFIFDHLTQRGLLNIWRITRVLLISCVSGKSTPVISRNCCAQLKPRTLCKVVLAFAFVGSCASVCGQNGASIDEIAHLLAGLPVTGTLTSFMQNGGWQAHAAAMDKAWKTKEYFQLGPIASWMSSHAGEYYRSSGTMYYMFSGPDFLYAYTFFPDANTYILAGLEPVGQVPDLSSMSADTLNANLSALRSSMS